MLDALPLTSPDNPRIKGAARLQKHRDRRKAGLFLAEGLRELSRAAAAGYEVEDIFVAPDMLGCPDDGVAAIVLDVAPQLADADTRLWVIPARVMSKLAYCENPEGIIAVVREKDASLEQVIADLKPHPLLLVAVGISKPGNLGAMARTAAAAGADALLIGDGVVDVYNPNAIRASTGAVFGLPIAGGSSSEIRDALAARGIRMFAAILQDSISCFDANLTGGVAMVIGAEDVGLDDAWREAAKAGGGACLRIPMRDRLVDSLNASNAAAVLLYEAVRQRG